MSTSNTIQEVHLNDIGTVIRATIRDNQEDGTSLVLDISSATTLTLYLKKPNGTILTKTASFTTDGTDGKMEYTTISGDIDVTGNWKLQASITTPSGTWRSDIGSFKVHKNL